MIENLIGKEFGDLTIIALDKEKTGGRKTYWWFQCVCGNKLSIRADTLKIRKMYNCGCKEEEKIIEEINRIGLIVIKLYRKNKKIRAIVQDVNGYKGDLTYKDIIDNNGGFNFVDQRNPYTLENILIWTKLNNKTFELIGKNNYFNSDSKLNFYCHNCTDTFSMNWESIWNGSSCNLCAGKYIGKYNTLEYVFPELAQQWIESENNLLPNQVTFSCGELVYWQCPKNKNHKWWATVNQRTNPNLKTGCPQCNESKGEKRVSEFLLKNNISFIPQYKFNNCRNKHPLPFDFYLPDYNCLIEYDGLLHFEIARWFDKDRAQLKLEECQRNDSIKTQFCLDNDIPLLRIPYWDFDNIEQILSDYLNLNNN